MLLLPSCSTVAESLLTYVGGRNSALYAVFLRYKERYLSTWILLNAEQWDIGVLALVFACVYACDTVRRACMCTSIYNVC